LQKKCNYNLAITSHQWVNSLASEKKSRHGYSVQ